jgi:L-malate glycosyltransferase
LNILLVSSQSHPCPGGVDTYVHSLMSALTSKGHHVDLLCYSDTKRLSNENQMAIRFVSASLWKNAKDRLSPFFGTKLYAFSYLFNLIDLSKYDLIHTNCGISSLAVSKYVRTIPFIGTIHGSYLSEERLMLKNPAALNPGEAEVLKKFDYCAVSLPDKILTVSSYIDPAFPAIPKEKHRVVHSGVDTLLFKPIDKKNQKIKIATAGFLEHHKGYDIFLDALIKLKNKTYDIDLIMYGAGSQLEDFKRIAKYENIPIVFPGNVTREELAKELPKVDIFVHPSRIETFGLAVTEAMASGCLPVCSNVGGLVDQIDHMKNGILFETEDSNALANSLEQLINDRLLRERLSRAARKTVENKFSLEKMTDRYDDLYQEIIKTNIE